MRHFWPKTVLWRQATRPILLISHQRFCLFPKVKTAFRRKRFRDVADIKTNVTAELNVIRSEAFAEFSKPELIKPVIHGDYFE